MRRSLLLVLLAVLILGSWYCGSQAWAIHDFRSAAQAGDGERLSGRVDFPALRESLSNQLRDRIRHRAEGRGSLLETIGSRIAAGAVEPTVNALLTPEAVARIVREGQAAQVRLETSASGERPEWTYHPRAADRFALVSGQTALIFHLEGLGWKLASIELGHGQTDDG